MCICRTSFVLQGFHIASYGYLGGADKADDGHLIFESNVLKTASISGTNMNFVFLGWPTSVGLERGVMLQCWFRGNITISNYLLNCDGIYWQTEGKWWHTLWLMLGEKKQVYPSVFWNPHR